ncbi:hypothetical protein [Aggregatibacter actinomycetemcomitans]|uniref:hypothetical protein n=1 Tax=Aggregatibacter actinomycetemcomitans TaxID=714 RepID=UPI00192E6EB9|nr:hypothetical protein [Aggregatibacter actinomycetemcomitans]
MAAEKLTKKRLIQILIMLIVLLTAFFYRTFYYEASGTGQPPAKTLEKNTALSGNKN